MGIKLLTKFLRENFPEVFDVVHLSQFRYKKIAIDTSLYLCHYKAQYGDEGWLRAFINLVSCLRRNDVHCVFIYDGGYPKEKENERNSRISKKEKSREKIQNLKTALDNYYSTGEIDPALKEFQKQRNIQSMLSKDGINTNMVEFLVKKMEKQNFSISHDDFRLTKELFDILDIPYFEAPMEAETMAADLCLSGKVDAVMSEDSDLLAYGCPVFLTKLNTREDCCYMIRYEKLLEAMKLTNEQFLDFCIMCGTDYNKNIFRFGVVSSYKAILQYKTIEKFAEKTGKDISILNHVRVRELFREYEKTNVKVPYCGFPNMEKLASFIGDNRVHINTESVRKAFIQNERISIEK